MWVFPIRIENALDVTIQRPHDANAGEHRRAAVRRDQKKRLHRRLPFRAFRWSTIRDRASPRSGSLRRQCRSCRKGRYAPPVSMVKLTEAREIAPYPWVHPDEER
jgi:hypothetical protein